MKANIAGAKTSSSLLYLLHGPVNTNHDPNMYYIQSYSGSGGRDAAATMIIRGATNNLSQVPRQDHHNTSRPLLPPRSISQIQSKTMVLPVLPTTAPLIIARRLTT